MSSPRSLLLSPRLEALILACQKSCVAECCGIEAFDFSPLHVASFLSAFTGGIDADAAAALQRELTALAEVASRFHGDPNGLLCSIPPMNQRLTLDELHGLIAELKRSIAAAPEMVERSEALRRPSRA